MTSSYDKDYSFVFEEREVKDFGKIEKTIAEISTRIDNGEGYGLVDDLFFQRGLSFQELGKDGKAVLDFSKSIDNLPNQDNDVVIRHKLDRLRCRGQSYLKLKRTEDALDDFSKAIALNPNDHELHYYNGLAFKQNNDFHKAIISYRKGLNLCRKQKKKKRITEFYRLIGEAFCIERNFEQSKWNYTCALKSVSKNKIQLAFIHFERGHVFVDFKKYESAILDFSACIKLDEKGFFLEESLSGRGYVYRCLGKYPEAVGDFSQLIKMNPLNDSFYLSRGECYFEMQKAKEAEKDFSKSIALTGEKNIKLFVSRGNAFYLDNQHQNAILDYTRAISALPRQLNDPNLWIVYQSRKNAVEKLKEKVFGGKLSKK